MTTSTPPQPYTADRPKNSTTSVDANLPVAERDTWIGPSVPAGHQWHVFGSDLFDFIVEHQSEIRANFGDVQQPEEHALQWVVLRTARLGELKRGDHVAMQWEGWSPRRLSFAEVGDIAALGQFLFARKAQFGCALADWITWAHRDLANLEGAQKVHDFSEAFRSNLEDTGEVQRTAQCENLCDQLVAVLQEELLSVLGRDIGIEKRSRSLYLIDSGRRHSRGGRLFLLCFAEPSPGIAVVPALPHADLGEDRLRFLPRHRFFLGS